jgi:hypothetical protein
MNDVATALDTQLFFFCRFVFAIRRVDEKPYPPGPLQLIMSAIQRHIRDAGHRKINIWNKSETTYSKFRAALDARMKELTAHGVGIVKSV